jgi:hypothetical protein
MRCRRRCGRVRGVPERRSSASRRLRTFDHDAHPQLGLTVADAVGRIQIQGAIAGYAPNPNGWTAIGEALASAHDSLDPVTGYDVKATVLLTDGRENHGPHNRRSILLPTDHRRRHEPRHRPRPRGLGPAGRHHPDPVLARRDGHPRPSGPPDAPAVDFGATLGPPSGFAFQTILPAGDGDVTDNDGAKFYDTAVPGPFKSQPFVRFANHNWFNRQWVKDDPHMGPPIMSRPDHEHVLSTYGCALFRAAFLGHGTTGVLAHRVIPGEVIAGNVDLSFEWEKQTDVDHHEDGNGIGANSMGGPTSQSGGLVADEYPFRRGGGAFNGTFYGNTIGMVAQNKDPGGQFRSELDTARDLRGLEVWIRAAEVSNGASPPAWATGFQLALEDRGGLLAWVDTDQVGGVPRPYDRPRSKTMPNTFRFPADCFTDVEPNLDLANIQAIRLRLDRKDSRALAFDVLQIVDR